MRFEVGQVIDHYEIVDALGEGAYAEAYKARDTRDGRLVVLKSPDPHTYADPQVYQRFQRETSIAQSLEYPGVQRSLDVELNSSEPYLVLEYVEGATLRARGHELGGPVPIDTALDWGRQIARALAYLHSKNIVHRDLKPENVLVGDDGVLKIADFGTALMAGARRLTWRNLTDSVGTPDYMSPEQIQGERGDARSDIYAWGVIMYEMLTGRVPFEGDNWLVVMAGHLRRTPERIRAIRPEVSPELEAVVLTAMRRHPWNRYETADKLLEDLDNLDTLDASSFDLSPEDPIGAAGGPAQTPGQFWLRVALIALSVIAVFALVIIVALFAKK